MGSSLAKKIQGTRWIIGDGKITRFWQDIWLDERPLNEAVVMALPNGFDDLRLCDYWQNGAGWLMLQIEPYLPAALTLNLWALVIDTVTRAKNRISWSQSLDGQFSVSSAFSFLTRDKTPRHDLEGLFKRVWRAVIPERVRVFLWLGVNQVIMTNVERRRRHLSDSGMCQVCKGGDETIIHILRDCPAMEGVLLRLVPIRKRHAFFTQSLLEWVSSNLGDTRDIENMTWATLFATTLWWGWKWRCINVFNGSGKCRDKVKFVKEQAREDTLAHIKTNVSVLRSSNPVRVERWIKWTRPSSGWMKLNTDGASRGNPGAAAAGGVIRDEGGAWCRGFALNIGICTAPLAELWGVYYGLLIAWESGSRRVAIEVDSEAVVSFLTIGISHVHPLSFLVLLCHGFISKDWLVRISYVHREANRLANGLANYAFSLPLGFHSFASVPDVVRSLFLEDSSGVASLRQVIV
ncbi:unnamed protein product [Microthlaspi erraticum]|uniref:RNase H type-1 domain-containing protein n=1 Tax=Microthlaspi erraticum TaxID=1685480 RepID=A0A6D2LI52_9BRAS|nr:unnamed protein product [Microthlaspi erraticum]